MILKFIETSNGKIGIDSSLLKKVGIECEHCPHRACCYEPSKLSESDIKAIRENLPAISKYLPEKNLRVLSLFGFEDFKTNSHTIRTISSTEHPYPQCLFLVDNKCLLKEFNIEPVSCLAYPVILDDTKTLRLVNIMPDSPQCLQYGTTPAYIALKKEIQLLFPEPSFYKALPEVLEPEEKKGLYYRM